MEFLQVTLPKMAKLWGSRSFAFFGHVPKPEPWMWQESQWCMWQMRFSMMVMPSFLTRGSPPKTRLEQ